MNIPYELSNEAILEWLHNQKNWEWQQYSDSSSYEQVQLTDLDNQSWIYTQAIHNKLKFGAIQYREYTYRLGRISNAIERWSEKIRKPTENKVSYTIRKVSEVLQ